MDFPLDIKICVTPSLNSTALKEFGYEDTQEYVIGASNRSNYATIGWGGHDHNGRDLTSAREVFNKVKLNMTKEDILGNIYITTHENDQIVKKPCELDLVKMNRVHTCQILKLDPEDMKGMKDMAIYFNEKIQNSSVEVDLKGRGLTPHRQILSHRFYSSGDVMKLNRVTTKAKGYIVRIKENVFVEGDPGQTCRNYPTSEFASYTECDDQYVGRKINQLAPGLNLTPVWMTDNLDMVTTLPLSINSSVRGKDLISSTLKDDMMQVIENLSFSKNSKFVLWY